MKRSIHASLMFLLFCFPYASMAADAPTRPSGVDVKDWVPISDRLGLVLVQERGPAADNSLPTLPMDRSGPPGNRPLLLKPPVHGYFMVKGAAGWTRLIVIEPVKGPADAG